MYRSVLALSQDHDLGGHFWNYASTSKEMQFAQQLIFQGKAEEDRMLNISQNVISR